MMARVRKEHPVELSVTTLFEAPTVRALGAVIRSRGQAAPAPPRPDPFLRQPAVTTHDTRTPDAAGK
jgi:hypothetical protein